VKRFLVLLVVAAGALAWASFAVPTNAAVVNGQAISQNQVNSDISAIASSSQYACFLNAEALVSSQGQSGLPALDGVGQQSATGPHTTSTTAFVASYLDSDIGHQLIFELAAQHHVHVAASDLTSARKALEAQITSVVADVASSQYACGSSAEPLTGAQVLASVPSSFVKEQLTFDATVSLLEEDLSGIGSSNADLMAYYNAHTSIFDTTCFTVAGYSTEAEATAAKGAVYEGEPFATVASKVAGGGPQGCDVLYGITSELPATAHLQTLALNTVSTPIAYNGGYLLVEITKRTTTPFAESKVEVQRAAQTAGSAKAQTVINADERKADVQLDPRYGTWRSKTAQVLLPVEPVPTDVLNAVVNSPETVAAAPSSSTATPASGASG
jgi:hypothetical protein